MKKMSVEFLYAVVAGLCISIGGTVYLSIQNTVVGAALFAVGLFTIVTNGFSLFTGKVCYLFDNPPSYLLELAVVWLGNLVGCVLTGLLLRQTRIVTIAERAVSVCDTKLSDGMLSIFILAVFCNILIYIAVDCYKNNPHHIGKYLGLMFGVMVFILSGFEHCVANMFYFSMANVWSLHTFLYLIVMTLGNAVGGIIFPLMKKMRQRYGS